MGVLFVWVRFDNFLKVVKSALCAWCSKQPTTLRPETINLYARYDKTCQVLFMDGSTFANKEAAYKVGRPPGY